MHRLLLSLAATTTALQPMATWGTSSWNWGSAVGGAHDAARELRGALSTEPARLDYLVALRQGRVSEASAKLCFALTCQRAARTSLAAPFEDGYAKLVRGEYESEAGLAELAVRCAPAIDRYNLNVQLCVKPERREEFLDVIRNNAVSTLREPRNLRYAWGESATTPHTWHFQESFVGKRGFDEHCVMPTFTAWEAFVGTSPFTADPSVQFYVPTTSVADDHAPSVVVAATLASMEFAEKGC